MLSRPSVFFVGSERVFFCWVCPQKGYILEFFNMVSVTKVQALYYTLIGHFLRKRFSSNGNTLYTKCPYSEFFCLVFYFANLHIQSKCRSIWTKNMVCNRIRMRTRKTPNTDTFYAVNINYRNISKHKVFLPNI